MLLSTDKTNKATKTEIYDIEEEYYSKYFNAFLLSTVQGTPPGKGILQKQSGSK